MERKQIMLVRQIYLIKSTSKGENREQKFELGFDETCDEWYLRVEIGQRYHYEHLKKITEVLDELNNKERKEKEEINATG